MRPPTVASAPVRRAATLALALLVLLTALILPTVPASAAPDETFADDFQTDDFTGSTGSQPWTGPWQESGESDGAGAGLMQVAKEGACADDKCLVAGKSFGLYASVERELDLSGYASATLTFDYEVHKHGSGTGTATLSVSIDGGGDWRTLDTWWLGTDTGQLTSSYDLAGDMAPDTRIRFSVAGSFDDSHLNVDNLAVETVYWVQQATPTNDDLFAVQFPVDDQTGYAAGDTGIILKTTNGGVNWVEQTTPTNTSIREIDFPVDANIGYAVGVSDTVLKTTNGTDWVAQTTPTGVDLRGVDFIDTDTGYAVGDGGTVLKTTDGGSNWIHKPTGSSEILRDVAFPVNDQIGWAVGTNGTILRTTDGGDSWLPQVSGTGEHINGIQFPVDTDNGYAVARGGVLLATTNGGATWQPHTTPTTEILHALHFPQDAQHGHVATDLGSVVATDSSGATWAIEPVPTSEDLLGIWFTNLTQGWVVGRDGLIFRTGAPPPPDPGVIVISEFSTRNDDFVELYNAGDSSVDIDGYVLEIDNDPNVTISQGGGPITLPPGGHYLLASIGSPLSPDQEFPFSGGLNSDVGLRLRDDANTLLDEVGAGTSSWFEGAALPAQTNGPVQSYERLNGVSHGNCVDTDNNLTDFVHNFGFRNPQNMAYPPVACGVATPAAHVVISEFRPEGPAGQHDEFVELFNPTAAAVDISGWIFHITQPGLFRDYHIVPGGTILDPGEHYLLSNDDGPTPADAQPYTIATDYSSAWGDVVLKNGVGSVVDVLGYGDTGNGQLYEGVALPSYEGGTADRSFVRRNGGYTDTDNNAHDFVYSFAASPQVGLPGPNRPPTFDQNLSDRSDVEGEAISFASPASDPDWADTLTYIATGLPQGISIDPSTGDIAGALGPTSSGTHSVTVTVTDDGSPSLQATDLFAWTVLPGEVTYLVANSGGANGGDDLLTVVDRSEPDPAINEVNIGTGTGSTTIEAAALQPGSDVLFAVDGDRLGTIDVTSGVFSPRPQIAGAGNGATGLIAFDNIEGLTFNPFTGELFGTHRRGNYQEDLLFRLDPVSGAHVPGAFAGDDYVPIETQDPYYHSADVAFDPTDGQLYVVHWTFTNEWSIATVNPTDGSTTTIGVAPADIASLAFDETGLMYTTTAGGGSETLYQLDKTDASVVSSIVIDNGSNYEAMAIAFPVDSNQIPVFDQDLPDRTDPEGSSISLSAAATDPDAGDAVTYSATGLPPGLSVASDTGLITGTINYAATGDYPVAITATDDGIPNLAATDTFTWTVSEMNQAPVFDQDLLDRTDAEGAVISLWVTATDPDIGDVLTYGASGLPPGLAIDTGTGLISGTIDYAAATGSPYTVTITATDDGAPSQSATPDSFAWTVANTNRPPVIVDPGAQTTPELALFTLAITATDPDAQTPSFTDGSTLPAWAVLTDNLDGTATIAGTPGAGDSGTTTVTITASDGGVPALSDPTTFDITVTNTNVAPTIANPGNQSVAEGAPFGLVVTGSDVDGTTVSFSDGGSLPGWATLVDNGDDTATITGTPGYTDAATTTVTITASDGSLTDDAIFDITVTNTNRAPIVDPIADYTVAEGAALVPIDITASDPDGPIPSLGDFGLPGWATFVDNGDGTGTITGTPGYTNAGSGTVGITAFDGALPDTETFTLTVTETNQPPSVNPVADSSVAEGTALTPITVTSSDPDGTDPSLAATGLPGWAAFVDNGDGTGTITGTPGYTDAAVTTVTIEIEDGGVPNLSDTTTFELTVTNTNRAPLADPIGDQTIAENDPFTLTVTGSDPDGTFPILAAAGLPGWALFVDNGDGTATITGTPGYTDAATTTVTITASDGSLTDDATFDLTVTNTNQAPVADPIANQTVAENDPFTLTVTGSDSDGTTPILSASGLPAWATFADNGDGTGTITGTPGFGDAATTTVTITASDGTLTDDAIFDLTVTDVNRPPVFGAGLGDRTNAEGATVSYGAGATDPDLNTLSYGATGLPPGVGISPTTGVITGTLTFTAAGTHTVVVTATDDGTPNLATTDTFIWTVTNTNRAPVADPIADQTIAENHPFTLTVTGSDPDGTFPALAAAGLPGWAAFVNNGDGTATITGTPGYTDAATSTVTITASDGTLTDDVTFDLTVTNTNQAPVFDTNLGDRTDAEDSTVSLAAGATDPDGDNLTYTVTDLPPGLSMDPATGEITGTVSFTAAGSHTVEVIVTDDGEPNLSATDNFTWTITNTNRSPIFNRDLQDRSNAEGATVAVDAGATDPDLDELTYSATGLPPGLILDTKTGRISGTVGYAASTASPYAVEITVTDQGDPELTAVDTFTWTITNTNQAPVLAQLDGELGAEETIISFVAAATDPDGDRITFSMGGAPSGATIDPDSGAFRWIPSEAQGPGSFTVTVQVTDDGTPALTASKNVTITVTETNQLPTIAPIEDQLNGESDPVELVVVAADVDLPANTLSYTAAGLPAGLDINPTTGVVTGTIGMTASADSPYDVTIKVTDDGTPDFSAATTFAWTVTAAVVLPPEDPNEPPLINPITDQLDGEDDTVDLTVVATDTDTIIYAATGLPPGLTIDSDTGRISGTVDSNASTGSPYTTTITATDNGIPSLSSTDTFTWTITNRPAAQRKEQVVNALEGFQETPTETEDAPTIRRSLVLMGSTAAATAASLRWPLTLLLAILIGVAFVGRIGLYPLLWRGDRRGGTVSFYDPELGFGLIAPDDDKGEIFVHENAFRRRQRQALTVGTRVKYRLLASENRPSAWGATIEADND